MTLRKAQITSEDQPAFDIVNTALYDGYDQNLALSIGGSKPHLDQVTRVLCRLTASLLNWTG